MQDVFTGQVTAIIDTNTIKVTVTGTAQHNVNPYSGSLTVNVTNHTLAAMFLGNSLNRMHDHFQGKNVVCTVHQVVNGVPVCTVRLDHGRKSIFSHNIPMKPAQAAAATNATN